MKMQVLQGGITIVRIAAALAAFVFLMLLTLTAGPGRFILEKYEKFSQDCKEGKNDILDYSKTERFLCMNGAAFHFGSWVNPITYTALRIVLCGIGLFLGASYEIWLGFLTAAFFLWIPDFFVITMNAADNNRLLPELKLVYHAIAIQVKSGVYIVDSLAECYGSVREKRLKQALRELSGDLVMKSDVDSALEKLQGKFDNRYIDTLCITILQALESGQAVDVLNDIAEQIKDMEAALLDKKKTNMDRSITFYQLGILTAILIVVIYTCVTHMFAAAAGF